jgi:hypothetical protein
MLLELQEQSLLVLLKSKTGLLRKKGKKEEALSSLSRDWQGKRREKEKRGGKLTSFRMMGNSSSMYFSRAALNRRSGWESMAPALAPTEALSAGGGEGKKEG